MVIPLWWYLVLAAVLFCIGLYAALARRDGTTILMGILMMLSAVIINLAAFWRYGSPASPSGQVLAVFVYPIAVAEAVVGLALFVKLWRVYGVAAPDDLDSLKG